MLKLKIYNKCINFKTMEILVIAKLEGGNYEKKF